MREPVTVEPQAGLYKMRLVAGGPYVAVRIWHGQAIIDSEPQDRSHDWRVEIDGRTDRLEKGANGYRCRVAIDVGDAWPYCARNPIDRPEYDYLMRTQAWAKQHEPYHPSAAPRIKARESVKRLKPIF